MAAHGAAFAAERGANVNMPDANGDLPLRLATRSADRDSINVTKALVVAGADPHLRIGTQESPY